jgi:hypothetical protein
MLGLRPEVREGNGGHGKTDKFSVQLSGRFSVPGVSGNFRKTRSKRPDNGV